MSASDDSVKSVPSMQAAATGGSTAEMDGPTPIFYGRLHFAGFDLGKISSYNGIPHFSPEGKEWVRARSGIHSPFCSLEGREHEVLPQKILPRGRFNPEPSMPRRDIVLERFQSFLESPLRPVFPLLDPVLFRKTVNIAFGNDCQNESTRQKWSARACIFAFLAMLFLFDEGTDSPMPRNPYHVDQDACAAEALHLVTLSLPSTEVSLLEASIMLVSHFLRSSGSLLGGSKLNKKQCIYYAFSGQIQLGSFAHAMSCRIAFVRGGHLQPQVSESIAGERSLDVDQRTSLHIRRLFWICYVFDKDFALRTGQPPSIDDDQCELSVPPEYRRVRYSGYSYDSGVIEETVAVTLPVDLDLSVIKSKVYRVLYSLRAMRKLDHDLLRDIRELDEELENWRQTVPAAWRPLIRFASTCTVDMPGGMHDKMRIFIVHLEYYYLMAMIHSASGRCQTWNNKDSGERHGVRSSLQLCVEASRSTLFYLRSIRTLVPSESFWYPHAPLPLLYNDKLNVNMSVHY